MMDDKLLNTKEAAKYLGVSEAFLERDRWAGATIPFVRVGARGVKYEPSTLRAYVKSRIRLSTSDTGKAQKRGKA
jgi:hypothetical protein